MQTVAEKPEEVRNLRINLIPVRITNCEITAPHHNKNTNNYVTRKCANTQKRSWSNNLIHIRKENLVYSSTNSFHFVPALLLSNTMSLAPKIDQIAYTIKQKNLDLALFTETWLKESIPDQSINITGYQLFQRWSEIKQLCRTLENNRPDFRSNLSINLNCGDYDLANKINEAFIGVMLDFEPLTEEVCVMENAEDEPIQVTCDIVVKKLHQLSTTKANVWIIFQTGSLRLMLIS